MNTTTIETSQMSHTRPFRWRRKAHEAVNDKTKLHHKHHQHLTLRSSAIGHHKHQSLSYEQVNMSNITVYGPRPEMAATNVVLPLTSSLTHSRRYSPSNLATPMTTPTTRTRCLNRLASRSCSTFSLPMLISLSIFACVILSLLNLTADQMQLKMVVAIGSVAASSSTINGATQTPSQSTAALQQQAQQSNSVISYPAVSAGSFSMPPTTSSTTKAKYKTMYACEDRQLTMDCETGSKINLIRANFGRFSITQCNEQGQLDLAIDCMSPISFRIMQDRCQDKQRCSVNATSAIFGDRCPTTRKYLEVHFQCLPDHTEHVNLREQPPIGQPQPIFPSYTPGPSKPPTQPLNSEDYPRPPSQLLPQQQPSPSTEQLGEIPQLARPVINSQVMTPAMAINHHQGGLLNNKLPGPESIVVSLRHLGTENVSRPRCYQWDSLSSQWSDRGASIIETNQTHTICAFDQQTSYVLVMDYSGPIQPIFPKPSIPDSNMRPPPDLLDSQPIPISPYPDTSLINPPGSVTDDGSTMISPPAFNQSQNQQSTNSSARLFLYLLSMVVVAIALMALTLVASSMRSTAGAALKSLGNFAPFNGPKYKHRRQTGVDAPSLHSNKDLLVINNSHGHSFIYAPASTTKISSSSSTHILSSGTQAPNGHQTGTLHRLQQQQMYSGNGATLSSLSGTGAQSNNYYYGLMGLNPLLQQQQQQHHFSQHHLNQSQQQQQAQLVGQQQQHQQQQVNSAASYNHQANKSSVSTESANSSSSSSGVESGSTSMQQQQQLQARTQQACLVSAMNNNDFHLMGHHISNYGQHQPQQHNLFATLKGASVTHQPHQHQPTFTVNAHYSTSGVGIASGVQSINMTSNQTTTPGATAVMLHNRQASNQMRDHIYECVDDDKPYMPRLLMPTQTNSQHQIFGSPTFMSTRRATTNDCNARLK